MSTTTHVDIADAFARGTPIDEAMNEAVRQAVERHRQAGAPLVVWLNGRVEQIAAETVATEKTETKGNGPACP
jgi:monomeric isocitrate dehydrogenase